MNSIADVLLPLLIVIGIVLFNFLSPRLARWQQEQERLRRESLAREEPSAAIEAPEQPNATVYFPPSDVVARPIERKPAAVAPTAARRSATARSYLAGRSKLRQAIIAATVLGPCRAHEPKDERA